jgi:DNA (cytosine-5)-methyltransferase 1
MQTELIQRGAITNAPFSAIDLFCGAGGFSLGLRNAGFRILLGVDSWQMALDTHAKNFHHRVLCADAASLSGADILHHAGASRHGIDLLVGGPPCQGFSIQRIGSDADGRNNLVVEFARLIAEIGPRMFVMENVPGLIGKRGRNLFEVFLSLVGAAGFDTEAHLVNAADYGAPQIRRRVVVLGWRRADTPRLPMPEPSVDPMHYKTVQDAIGDLPAAAEPGQPNRTDPLHKQTKLSDLNRERLRFIPPGGGMIDLPVHLRVTCHKAGADKIGHRYVYGRLAPHRPAGTITARFDSFTRGRFAHPFENRNVTLREGARLQTFPDDFLFVGNQEEIALQIGNAIPPVLADALARSAVRALQREEQVATAARSRLLRQIGLFKTGTSD